MQLICTCGMPRLRCSIHPERAAAQAQHERLFDCLNRFVRAEDAKLSDADFVEMVHRRWLKDREGYIGDVGDGVDLKGCFDVR